MSGESNDVVITGLGPVTSIGVGNAELWESLVAERTNVGLRTLLVDAGKPVDLPLASMPAPIDVAGSEATMAFLKSQDCTGYRDLAYTILAIERALADAGVEYDRDSNRIGVIQAFEAPAVEAAVMRLFEMPSGPMPAAEPTLGSTASRGLQAERPTSSPTERGPDTPPPLYELLAPYFYKMQPFFYVYLIGKALGLRGFSTSVHNACTSGAHAIDVAAERIRSGQADVMVVAGGEAFESGVRMEWFRRLDLYAGDERMAPFDPESSGFYLGEGAGAIVLESARHASRRGARVYAEYLGGSFAHQGWKQTLPDVRARRLRQVISDALTRADVPASKLDLVVPHGAATPLSDRYEAVCLAEALNDEATPAVATAFKPYVGHMLAACGIIDTLCALLSLHHQCVPPTLNTNPDRVVLPVPLVTTLVDRPIRTVLKLCTGFTGHDAALLFRRV